MSPSNFHASVCYSFKYIYTLNKNGHSCLPSFLQIVIFKHAGIKGDKIHTKCYRKYKFMFLKLLVAADPVIRTLITPHNEEFRYHAIMYNFHYGSTVHA
jgi:hypothetical protein